MSTVVLVLLFALQAPGPKPAGPVAASDNNQEAFVIEQSIVRQRFENDGTGRRETHARIKVQSDAGVQMWGQLVFGYNAGTERLEIEYVRVREADGSVITAPADSVQDLTSPVQQQAPVYTDFRQKHVTVPGLRPGETLEYSIVNTIHTPLAAGHFWTEYDFEREAIVLDEQLELDVPAARTVTLKTAPEAEPKVTTDGDRRIYRWKSAHTAREPEKDEETLQEEAEAEAENPRRAAVRLTTFASWDEVGRWYVDLEKPSRILTPELREKAVALTAGLKSDIEKLEALYDFVAPNFRYVSISLGMGRYQPRAAADVLRDQYGDCKDKHTLLAALMEAIGLRASTVLINSHIRMDPDFPSPSQFDHAITRANVGGQDVWLDVTPEVAPFRLLSPNLRKKQALVVSSVDGSRLAETPADPPMQNVTTQEVTGTLGELGTFKATVKFTVRGDVELLLRTIFRSTPAASWKQVVEGINKSTGPDGEVTDWRVSDPVATDTPFEIEFKVSKVGLVDWTKKSATLVLPYSNVELPASAGKPRTRPIELGSPLRLDYRLALTLGPGYKARAPIPVSVKRDYGAYTATYALDGQQLTARRLLEVTRGSIPADRAGDFAAFGRAVVADTKQALALDIIATTTTTSAPDLKASELVRSGHDALQNRRYEQAITLLKRALEMDPKDTKAWNYLGDTYVALRRYNDALDAYDELVKVNPYDEFVHNDIAYVNRVQQRYPEAEASFRKQLELNPLDKFALTSLGGLLVDMKKYDEAVPQIEKAISLSPEDASLRVSLGTALLQLSRHEQALAAFDKAVELAPNANTWNNIAYQLALKGVELERAQQYAESAVSTAAAVSRNLTLNQVTMRELAVVVSLSAYWDTLGWVYFAKGDLDRAETLVSASWFLDQRSEVGDHLGQIYEKQGKTEEAIHAYALAANAERATRETRRRLGALMDGVGAEAKVLSYAPEILRMRTLPLDAPKGSSGMADFVVLLGADGRAEDVRFVSGQEKLRSLADAIRKLQFGSLPDVAPARVIRRGTVNCDAKGCAFILFPASHAQPVQ
jgi:tetratricopeptide (TPR) repeat protein/transglutaminase-like putative cysteine protease